MYKKLLHIIFSVAVLLCFAACNGSEAADGSAKKDTPTPTEASAKTPTSAPKGDSDAPTPTRASSLLDAIKDGLLGSEQPTTAPADDSTSVPTPSVGETVIVDDDSCTFKIVSVEEDARLGYTLHVFLENKTDLNLTFSWDEVAVNGLICDPYWIATVPAKTKTNEEIQFSVTDFEKNGLSAVTVIQFVLSVFNTDDWSADTLIEETFSFYPMGEAAVTLYERAAQPGDITIVDSEACTMIVTGFDPDAAWGYTVNVYLENKTDQNLMFSLDDVSVNGFMCDPFWAFSLPSGIKANETILFSASDFELNEITEVTDIEFTLTVYDNDNWMADYFVEDHFSVYPMGEAAVKTYERTAKASDIVLFDTDECTMIITGFDPDNLWGYAVNVYLENKTDSNLIFSLEDATVNDLTCDPFWMDSLAPGKKSNTEISWWKSDLESKGITDVETITLSIQVYDKNNWGSNYISDTFTVTP
ncbi:MAG: hypothetical protein ACI4QX_00680 [Lachnospiraceae bacterium]